MNIEKESELIKRISELTGKSTSTLYDWKKKNLLIYEALTEYANLKRKNQKEIEEENIDNQIIKALNKLPNNKKKKFYYLIMAELAEIGH